MFSIDPFIHAHFDNGISYTHEDYVVPCPFCADRYGSADGGRKLHISMDKHTCHCYRCDYAASWVQLVMDVAGYNYARAYGELYIVPNPKNIDDVTFKDEPERAEIAVSSQEHIFPKGYQLLSQSTTLLASKAKSYLRQRGFTRDIWEWYQAGVAPSVGYRVIIPIEGAYWQARAMRRSKVRYMSPKMDALSALFNAPALERYDEVVVCEGALSAMAVGKNAIGTVGKNATRQRISRMVDSDVRSFVLVVEEHAASSILKLADALAGRGKRVSLWEYGNNTDPADWVQPVRVSPNYDFGDKVRLLLN